MTKAGAPCVIPPITGGAYCAAHDEATRAIAQASGGHARGKRPGYLSREQAEADVVFASRKDVKATLERLARHVVCGELDKGSVNATILAANGALAVMNDEERAAKGRAQDMSDAELDAMIDAEVERRMRIRSVA